MKKRYLMGVKFTALLGNYDRQTIQPTQRSNMREHREVTDIQSESCVQANSYRYYWILQKKKTNNNDGGNIFRTP